MDDALDDFLEDFFELPLELLLALLVLLGDGDHPLDEADRLKHSGHPIDIIICSQ